MDEKTSYPAPKPALTDAEAQRVLARAAEIDRERRIPIDELRKVALEAGINPDAFDTAVAEAQAPVSTAVDRPRKWYKSPWLYAALIAAAVVIRRMIG